MLFYPGKPKKKSIKSNFQETQIVLRTYTTILPGVLKVFHEHMNFSRSMKNHFIEHTLFFQGQKKSYLEHTLISRRYMSYY